MIFSLSVCELEFELLIFFMILIKFCCETWLGVLEPELLLDSLLERLRSDDGFR
jgi:hypothetical protein